jgi:2-desacetyl-2-hydroxyethyl bacteriochlorophyllide A dehydrogenase
MGVVYNTAQSSYGSGIMLQITLAEPGRFTSQNVEPPVARDGDALVRIRRIGVCGTDLHAFAGRQPFFQYPRVLGHELGVEIVSLPEGAIGLTVGDHCCIEPYLNCGTCRPCLRGKTNCCENLRVLGVHCDGGMQDYFAVPVTRLYPSRQLSLDQLALVETLGIGQHAVERAALTPGEEVLIVGAGPIGLAIVQFAVAAGAQVTVLEQNPMRRTFAERFGVRGVGDVENQLFDVVFDATGNQAAMQASVAKVAFGGKLVFVGIVQNTITFDDPLFHRREMTILASRNSAGAFPAIIAAIAEGRIDTTPWITHRVGLREVVEHFPDLPKQPGLIKAMIEVD